MVARQKSRGYSINLERNGARMMRKSFLGRARGEEPAAIKSSSSSRISFLSGAVVPERVGRQTLKAFAIADFQFADSQIIPSPGHRPGFSGHRAGRCEPRSEPSGASALSHPPLASKTRTKRVRNHYLSPLGDGFIFIFPHEILALNKIITNY